MSTECMAILEYNGFGESFRLVCVQPVGHSDWHKVAGGNKIWRTDTDHQAAIIESDCCASCDGSRCSEHCCDGFYDPRPAPKYQAQP